MSEEKEIFVGEGNEGKNGGAIVSRSGAVLSENMARRAEWRAGADDDKETYEAITSVIDPDIANLEIMNGQCYVYLGEDLFARLHLGARMGLRLKELPAFAGIRPQKLDKLLEKYTLLRGQIDLWRQDIISQAKMNLWKTVKEGDVDTSKWVLERLAKEEYGKTQTVDVRKVSIGFNGGSVANINALKEARDKIYAGMLGNSSAEKQEVRTLTVDGGRLVGAQTIDVNDANDFKVVGDEKLEEAGSGERKNIIQPISETK